MRSAAIIVLLLAWSGVAHPSATGSLFVVTLESVARDTITANTVRLVGTERGTKVVGDGWTRIADLPPGDYTVEVGELFLGLESARAHVRSGVEDTVTVVLSPRETVPPGRRYITKPPAVLPIRPDDDRRFPLSGFSFKFWNNHGERIDTAEGKVTKDLVGDPDTTTSLVLTKAELDSIRKRMIEIRLFDMESRHPAGFAAGGGQLEVTAGGVTKRLDCAGVSGESYPPDDWKRMRDLMDFIRDIVAARPEYKALPPARGAYL